MDPARDIGRPRSIRLPWRHVRRDHDRLVDLGIFRGEPVELIGGQLVVAEPQGTRPMTAMGMADDALRAVLPAGWIVRAQGPVALDDDSEPEPDLAIVRGTRADYTRGSLSGIGRRYTSSRRSGRFTIQ